MPPVLLFVDMLGVRASWQRGGRREAEAAFKGFRSGGWPTLLAFLLLALFGQRVPHPFAFFAKGWAAPSSIYKLGPKRYRFEIPTLAKERKGGAPSEVVNSRKPRVGHPPTIWTLPSWRKTFREIRNG